MPSSTQWNSNTVWWNGADFPGNNVEINLGEQFSISSLILQGDNNDIYPIFYRNGNADSWHAVWNAPAVSGWGMQTRSIDLGAPIHATSFLIGNGNGDNYYSVSEFQAIGTPVPEPETYAMLLLGLGLLGFMTCRREESAV